MFTAALLPKPPQDMARLYIALYPVVWARPARPTRFLRRSAHLPNILFLLGPKSIRISIRPIQMWCVGYRITPSCLHVHASNGFSGQFCSWDGFGNLTGHVIGQRITIDATMGARVVQLAQENAESHSVPDMRLKYLRSPPSHKMPRTAGAW